METEKRTIYIVAAVAVVAALLLSCVAGAAAGGVAGLVVGRRQAEAVIQRELDQELERRLSELAPSLEALPVPLPEGEIPLPFRDLPAELQGALVMEVVADTPAERAGLKAGDVIVGIDNAPVDADHPLPALIAQYRPGDRVTVHYWREGREDQTTVTLAENPEAPDQTYLGVFFRMLIPSERGAPLD